MPFNWLCESLKVSDENFLANEDVALAQATEDLLFYGLPINTNTVRLHHEFVPTTCPHRSMELHGGTTESVKAYFVERMQYFATLGDKAWIILFKLGNHGQKFEQERIISRNEDTQTHICRLVIEGKFGNGEERVKQLTEAGYDAVGIQKEVNRILAEESGVLNNEQQEELFGDQENNESRTAEDKYGSGPYTKDVLDTIAAEVIQGDWGNGEERRNRLEQAGYDYDVVQERVNEIME